MGQGSRSYSQVIDVGTNTTATVTNLTPGVTYYFAATAYTATRLESDFSAEVSYMLELPVEPPTGFTVTNDISFAVMQSLNLLEWTEISSFTVPATNPAMYFKLQGPR